ncbi:MAG: transferase [Pseudomonadota bacterium]
MIKIHDDNKGKDVSGLSDFLFRYHAALPQTLAGKPFLYEGGEVVTLHFDFATTQSHMCKSDPDKLVLGYTRTMMGFLLLQPSPDRIAMIGLGGGSLVKYCLRHVPDAHFTAVEINPDVIALREKFMLPEDGPKFRVICGDGADYVQGSSELVDVLLVDGFDRNGQPEQLCSKEFYGHCYAKLREGGVLVVNLLGSNTGSSSYAARIYDSFDGKVIVVDAEDFGNKIVFAYKGKDFPPFTKAFSEHVTHLPPYTLALYEKLCGR